MGGCDQDGKTEREKERGEKIDGCGIMSGEGGEVEMGGDAVVTDSGRLAGTRMTREETRE